MLARFLPLAVLLHLVLAATAGAVIIDSGDGTGNTSAPADDPGWVHELLGILQRRKATYLESMAGAPYDILELGGGSAASTVISPRIFDELV